MSFKWPEVLILLILVPIIAALYVWMQRRRQRYALQYASVSLVAQAVGQGPGVRRHIPAAIYLLALTAMIFALSRPQATIPVPENTGTVILTIDVSGSMAAEDVQPSRMEATKQAVRDFVNKQPSGVKIGIVSFSDFGALVAPPTTDRRVVLDALSRLRPQAGTNIGGGLQTALDAIYGTNNASDSSIPGLPPSGIPGARVPTPTPTPLPAGQEPPAATIVLLSDGESKIAPDPLTVAQSIKNAGIKVYTVGIGTAKGTTVTIQGRPIPTRLDEDTLKGVADITGGKYYQAQNQDQLHQIYDELSRQRHIENQKTEITFLLTGVALALSVVAGGLGLLWFNRLP